MSRRDDEYNDWVADQIIGGVDIAFEDLPSSFFKGPMYYGENLDLAGLADDYDEDEDEDVYDDDQPEWQGGFYHDRYKG